MKIRFNFLITFTMLLLYMSSVRAQSAPSLPSNIISPLPTSAVYRQFCGYTPSLVTGTINVPIPLYEIKVGNYSFPITLEYNTQGIKVNDVPYPAGYGWVLTPGLRITRTVMGRTDEHYNMDIRFGTTDFNYLKNIMHNDDNTISPIDSQNDIFTIHLPNGNYSFLLKKDGDSLVAITAGNLLKIVPKGDYIKGFEITDENGVIYYFGMYENEQIINNYVEYTNTENTAWMLRSIKLPGENRNIQFSWASVSMNMKYYLPTIIGGEEVLTDDAFYNDMTLYPEFKEPFYDSDSRSFEYSNANSKVLFLSKIDFPSGNISFNYKDASNPFLTNISVQNVESGEQVKSIDFTYGTGDDVSLLKTLKMSGEKDYKFDYNPMRFKNEYAQDYWGYYNGKNNNSLIPLAKVKTYKGFPQHHIDLGYYTPMGKADRNVDTMAMRANILTRIDYPTGGFSEFEYEVHHFPNIVPDANGLAEEYKVPLSFGGGLRVSKIVTQADGFSNPCIKKYKYGIGNLIWAPTLDTFIEECGGYKAASNAFYGADFRLLYLKPHSCYSELPFLCVPLWYDTVTEYVNGNKTVYKFRGYNSEDAILKYYKLDTSSDFGKYLTTDYKNLFTKGPLMKEKIDYILKNGIYKPIQKIEYNYQTLNAGGFSNVDNLFVERSCINYGSGSPDFVWSTTYNVIWTECGALSPTFPIYKSIPTSFKFYTDELNNEKKVSYVNNDSIVTKTNYVYTSSGNLLQSKTITLSDGTKQIEDYLYPKDYYLLPLVEQKSYLPAMTSSNFLAYPIQITQTKNGAIVNKKIIQYKNWGNNLFLPEKEYYGIGNNAPESRVEYKNYDSKGNPRGIVLDNSSKVVYLWGYNSQYPVAKIEGLTYDEVKDILTEPFIQNLATSSSGISTLCNSIRTSLKGKALVTSFTYKPLVGMTSMTNQSGETNTYNYDKYGRLIEVIDCNGKCVENYIYYNK